MKLCWFSDEKEASQNDANLLWKKNVNKKDEMYNIISCVLLPVPLVRIVLAFVGELRNHYCRVIF